MFYRYQDTAMVPVCTVLVDGFLVELVDDLFEDDTFHFLSLPSSISICSCLHSWLQNGVFPLQLSHNNN